MEDVGEQVGVIDHLRDVDAVASMTRDELEAHAKTLRAVNAIADALLLATDVSDVFKRTLEAVAAYTHFPGVAIFSLDARGERLELLSASGFDEATLRAARWLPVDGSLTGIAVREHRLVTTDDVVRDRRTATIVRGALAAEGFTGTASVPLLVGAKPVGALNLIYRGGISLTPQERALVESLARVVALAVERVRHTEQLEGELAERAREERWRSFLVEASIALSSSLDLEETLTRVAALAVRQLATWCVVDLVQPGGELRRVAGAHADQAQQPLVDALVRATHLDPDAPEGVARAVRTGTTILGEIAEAQLRGEGALPVSTTDAEHLRRLRDLGGRSFLIVPLPARGRILGALSLVSSRPSFFVARDVARAEELAARCATAIENAQLYRQARDAIAARDVFLGVASHELKTPLTALQLTLQALLRREGTEPMPAERVRLASRQVTRLTKLIDSLLDVSRVQSGRLTLDRERVDLGELVDEVAKRFEDEAALAGCAIRVRARGAAVGEWDRLRLDQVVSNLISNAIKYGAGAPIECEVERAGELARLRVIDHGIGIAKEDLTRVFDRFERAVSARQYHGLGLGLHIASELARAHGGAIDVTSEPGAGATFTVALPIAQREP